MRGGLAVRVAQRDQRSLGIGIITGRIVTKRTEMEELYPGDPFRLVSNRHHLEGQVFRVMDMRLGDGRSNQLQVRIAQDVFNLNPNELVDTGSSLWRPPDATPLPVTQRFVWEMPFREMVQLMGPADSDALLAAKPTAGLLQATGRKPNPGATDIVIYVDGVEEDSAFFSPFGITTTDLAPLEDEIVVSGGVDLDDIVLGSLAVIADSSNETTEIIRIDLVTDSTLAVSRGMLDTVPQAHLTGKYIFAFDDTAMTDYNNRVAGTSVTVQLATRTPAGVLDVASAPSDTLLYDGRAIRPFRPANVQIEGYVEGPVDAQGLIDINVTWANRNRRTEVEVPLEWDDDDVTPEVGQTTIIEVYEEDGTTLLTTHADLPGTSFDVPITSFDGQPIGVVKIGAERDGYREWQAYSFIVFVSADNLILDSDDLVLDDETLYIGE
jgi:hypothetical protein